ncbi:UNVERIFIED_CONTAM: hypothetical protein H355_008262 [Colinus virginianus]|nr:hypothetical protein H355_008262 [Colinus virginianus]
MDVTGPETDWRSTNFRQKLVSQIDEAMRKAGVAHNKSSKDMESHVFMKAKTREEYLSLVARLIIHFRDIHNKKSQASVSDPMNALQNLTGGPPAGAPGMTIASRAQGAPMSGMAGLGPMGQQMSLPGQQQPPGNSGMAPHGMPGVSTATQQNIVVQRRSCKKSQCGCTAYDEVVPKVRAQLVQQQHAAAAAVQAAQAQAAQMGASAQSSIHGLTLELNEELNEFLGSKPPEGSSLPPFSEMIMYQMSCFQRIIRKYRSLRLLQGFYPDFLLPSPNMKIQVFRSIPHLSPEVSQNSITMMSSPSPVQQAQTPQSMPPPPQPQPSPQPGQPNSQPNSNVSSGPAPSPSSFLPSPSPQPSQSPAAARTPQNFSVPSPGPLNTPGEREIYIADCGLGLYFLPGNPNSVMSPASSSQSEEQQYLEKLKQLSKYIEPLRRMINKIDKNEDRKKDLSKMKSLLDILTDPSKRCPLKTLQKCEIALEKLKNDMAVPTPPPPPVPPTKQQYLCQPLLDAVLANIRSPVFNHSLYRTFMPAMTAIHGPPITAPVISSRKRKYEEDDRQTIPNVLQGEVARLNPKFLVNLDPSHCSNNGTVHLICKLAANPFLQSVYRYMTSKLLQLPDKHSVTALLNTWAQSIRQACLSAA